MFVFCGRVVGTNADSDSGTAPCESIRTATGAPIAGGDDRLGCK